MSGVDDAGEREKLESLFQSGLHALSEGEAAKAVAVFEGIINGGFSNATLLSTYGNALRQAGRFEAAVKVCKEAVLLEPRVVGFRINHGAAELAAGRWQEAVGVYFEARALFPAERDIHFNLGTALLEGRDYSAALEALDKAVELDSEFGAAWENLAAVRKLKGDYHGYLEAQQEALRLDPDNPQTRWNMGVACLMHEDWLKGWGLYESRRDVDGISRRDFSVPQWDGRSCPGDTVLVHAEQGFGDTFQFLRFLPFVRERVGKVVLLAQAPLVGFLGANELADEVIAHVDDCESYQWHLPLLSLPFLLGEQFESALSTEPYLVATQETLAHWGKVLPTGETLRVGFGWKGNSSYREDYLRSMTSGDLDKLLAMGGVEFISLQKGADDEALAAGGEAVRVLGEELDTERGAFVDTAAIVGTVDVVVTTDTALAHLAGAMGAAVWLLLPAVADWRWGIEGDTTHWYPTMRIFRQAELGSWTEPLEAVHSALQELSQKRAHELG